MTEQVDPFGPFKVKIRDDIAPRGEFEVQVVDEDGNLMDIETVPFDFYRQRYWKNRLRNWLEELVDDYADPEEFDLDENWRNMRLAWMDTFPEVEEEIRGGKSKGGTEEKEPDFVRYEREEKEAEAEDLLKSPDLLLRIDDVIHQQMAVEHRNALMNFMVGISALTEEPINLRWSGRSSTGKSHIATKAVRVFPPEMVRMYIGLSEKSMFYDPEAEKISENLAEVDLENKIIVILEEENAREFLDEAKPVLSHDKYEHEYGYTSTSGPEPVRKTVRLKGWPAYIGLSVTPEREIELGTRELRATPEMGEDKYTAVIDWRALRKLLFWEEPDTEDLETVRRAIGKLEPRRVFNPFIPLIRLCFPSDMARHQRDWDKLVAAIEAVTILHQKQRDVIRKDGEERIIATPFDCLVALDLFGLPLRHSMMELDEDQLIFHRHLKERAEKHGRRTGEEKSWDGQKELAEEYERCFGESVDRSTLYARYLEPLENEGGLEVSENPQDRRKNEYRVSSLEKTLRGFDLEKMREGLLNFEYNEDNLRKLCCETMRMAGENPGEDFSIEDRGVAASSDSYQNIYFRLKDRFSKSKEEATVDWESEVLNIFFPEKEEEEEESEPPDEKPEGPEGEEEPEPLFEKPEEEEEEEKEPERLCEECLEDGIDDKPAVGKFGMAGRERWLCRECARAAGFVA